jgi:putative ABC transport system permease protein
MFWIAMRMLTGDRTKFYGIIFGVAFAALLMAQQTAIFFGIMHMTVSVIEDTPGADLWVMNRDVLSVDDSKPMPDTALYRIRGIQGVKWAVPFFKKVTPVHLTLSPTEEKLRRDEDRRKHKEKDPSPEVNPIIQTVMLIGLDDATLFGAPPRMLYSLHGRGVEELRQADSVILDKDGFNLLWPEETEALKSKGKDVDQFLGRVFEMNNHRAIIVGICKASPNFQAVPVVYTTYSRAKQYVPPENKLLTYILVGKEDNVGAQELAQRIAVQSSYEFRAQTPGDWRSGFIGDTIWYYVTRTGIPFNFIITVVLGFIVGTAIAGQTFYQFTLENIKQFAALKAMGTSNLRILGMILLQALTVGPIGYAIGVGVAALFGYAMRDDPKTAFYMPWHVLALTGLAVFLICLLSSLLSIRRVMKVEPALVFRG